MNLIDHGENDPLEFTQEQDSAQRIREALRAQGLPIPLTEEEEFAAAERRMRARP